MEYPVIKKGNVQFFIKSDFNEKFMIVLFNPKIGFCEATYEKDYKRKLVFDSKLKAYAFMKQNIKYLY